MRVICLIVDAMGIGQMDDAEPCSCPANTVVHICENGRPIRVPNLERLGLGNLVDTPCIKPVGRQAIGSYGKMKLGYGGADTYMGHQILMGTKALRPERRTIRELAPVISRHLQRQGHSCVPFPGADGPLLADGCVCIADCMEAALGLSINVTASLQDTVPEQVMELAKLVREVVPVTRVIVVASLVFSFQDIVRTMTTRPNGAVGVDTPALCVLDENVMLRHLGHPLDYSGQCPTRVARLGVPVFLLGKAADVVQCYEKNCTSIPLVDSVQILDQVEALARQHDHCLIIANIQETDLSGHAEDVLRWADLLELVDARIPALLDLVGLDGAFLLSGDHGNDPYMGKGQHTREMTPCLVYARRYQPADLGIRETLADIGASITDLFHAGKTEGGTSVFQELKLAEIPGSTGIKEMQNI